MRQTEYTLFATKLGSCAIAWQDSDIPGRGPVVTAFQLPEASDHQAVSRITAKAAAVEARSIPPRIQAIIERVRRHFEGEVQDFRDIVVDLEGVGPFARAVYAAARNIPAGRTMTYGELARAVNRPAAARAVGQALAKNPVPLIIPCHRVLAAGNRPGGFSAAGGIATKARMLTGEGASLTLPGRKNEAKPARKASRRDRSPKMSTG